MGLESEQLLLLTQDERGVATLTLNRPQVHNAFDDRLVEAMIRQLDAVMAMKARALVLRAAGSSFCAGADLRWMRRAADYDEQQNRDDALRMATLLQRLNQLACPTLAVVQGPAYGGGVGLVACCDIALASEQATFALSEVRLGLVPSVISPYVLAAIGERAARRYFLSAEAFNAAEALRIGLVHEVVADGQLEPRVDALLRQLLHGGPVAQGAAKQLITGIARRPLDEELVAETARCIAALRASDEGREGVNAFLEKRKPAWARE